MCTLAVARNASCTPGFQFKSGSGRGFRLLFAASGALVPELRCDRRCMREDLGTSGYSLVKRTAEELLDKSVSSETFSHK